ncbi:hypothetical protein OE88DRAFT_1737822 [Heliocybe sulcata]|uniref:Uncharacterized protein n=1 Tax=Heliocybe sulcata TaxID=5364 RepID=A0A5C3MWP6_9AGAM|nr:hypothetical protein OE88DRAFT_1737822 [Heliocybe sulcata]
MDGPQGDPYSASSDLIPEVTDNTEQPKQPKRKWQMQDTTDSDHDYGYRPKKVQSARNTKQKVADITVTSVDGSQNMQPDAYGKTVGAARIENAPRNGRQPNRCSTWKAKQKQPPLSRRSESPIPVSELLQQTKAGPDTGNSNTDDADPDQMLREVLKHQNKMEKEIQTLRKQVASNQTIAASTASQSHADNTRRAHRQIREHEKRLEARKDKNTSGADDEEADNEGSKDKLDDQHWDELLKAP